MLFFPWRFVGLAVGKREFPGYRPPKSTPGLFLDFFRVREALGSTQKHRRTTLEAPTDPFAVSLFSVPGPAPDQNRPEYADPGSSKISRNTQIPVRADEVEIRSYVRISARNQPGGRSFNPRTCFNPRKLENFGFLQVLFFHRLAAKSLPGEAHF